MDISLIVAKSENNVIGCENKLPWRIPEDLKLFRKYTMDKALIMGRKTFESIGKPLPGRLNIVLSRNATFQAPDGVIVHHSLAEGLSAAQAYSAAKGQTEIMVIGGAEIFSEALEYSTRVYLTNIPRKIRGDAFFPADRLKGWSVGFEQEVECVNCEIDKFDFKILSKHAETLHRDFVVA